MDAFLSNGPIPAAKYQLHYVNVSAENIEALRQIYASEIYLFGY